MTEDINPTVNSNGDLCEGWLSAAAWGSIKQQFAEWLVHVHRVEAGVVEGPHTTQSGVGERDGALRLKYVKYR